jgi:RHS repeat-associated protein
MPVTNYYTIDGQMIGYKTAAGRKDFLTDALGSVTAEVDQTGATKTFDGRYKPYGGDLSSTGTRGSYGWVGTWGYRGTGLTSSSHYVRARNYSGISSLWTTVDPIWPNEATYNYSNANPIAFSDSTGLFPSVDSLCGTFSPCPFLDKARRPGSKEQKAILECMSKYKYDPNIIKYALNEMARTCRKKPGQKSPCVVDRPSDHPCYNRFVDVCAGGGTAGTDVIFPPPNVKPPKGEKCVVPWKGKGEDKPCMDWAVQQGCSCVIYNCTIGSTYGFCKVYVLHELIHCAGYFGGKDHNPRIGPGKRIIPPNKNDFVYRLAVCMCKARNGNDDPMCKQI